MKRALFIACISLILLTGMVAARGQDNGNSDYQYALIEAVKQKNLGNITEAVKLYRLVIQEKPDCDAAYYELGNLYLMTDNSAKGEKHLETAYDLVPENRWYTLAYLNALGVNEKYQKMQDILRSKIRMDPEEVEWKYQLANVYASEGKERRAIRALERIEKEYGFSEKVTLLKASVYESQSKFGKAKNEIEKVMRIFPEALQFRIVAAELSMKGGEEEEAAQYYREILELDSTNIFALTNLTDYYRKKEEYQKSFGFLARSFQSDMIDANRKLAILSYYLSEEKFKEEFPGELKVLIEEFTERHPEKLEGRLMATEFFIEKRKYDRAYQHLAAYLEIEEGNYPMYMQAILLANAASLDRELMEITDRALQRYPDSTDIRFFRAIALYEQKNYNGLLDNLEGVSFSEFSSDEYASQAKMLQAEAYHQLKDYSASDSLFESLIEKEPDNHIVMNNYSYYLAERGTKLEQAKRWSRETVIRNPDNATFLDTYAWILYRLGDFEEAEKYILDALRKGGENDPEINEHAGDIQKALGSKDIARSYYKKAIILGGSKDKLERKIDALDKEEMD